MSETIVNEMAEDLLQALHPLTRALRELNIATETPNETSIVEDVVRWQATVWRAADRLADWAGTGRTAWARTIGLEEAARGWVRAADAYILYRQMSASWRENDFYDRIGPVSSHLRKWEAGVRWDVRG